MHAWKQSWFQHNILGQCTRNRLRGANKLQQHNLWLFGFYPSRFSWSTNSAYRLHRLHHLFLEFPELIQPTVILISEAPTKKVWSNKHLCTNSEPDRLISPTNLGQHVQNKHDKVAIKVALGPLSQREDDCLHPKHDDTLRHCSPPNSSNSAETLFIWRRRKCRIGCFVFCDLSSTSVSCN